MDAVFGVFVNRKDLKKALRHLASLGFKEPLVEVIWPAKLRIPTLPWDLKTSVGKGAVLGAGIGLIAAFGVAAFYFYRLETSPFLGTPSFFYLLVLSVFCAFAGAGAGALVGIGTPPVPETRYKNYLDDGGIILTIHKVDPKQNHYIRTILKEEGAQDVVTMNDADAVTHVK